MNSKIVKIDVKWLKNFKNLLIYLKFLETKPLSKLNEETMAKKQKSPSSSASDSEHAPLLDSAATRLVKSKLTHNNLGFHFSETREGGYE